MKIKIEDRGQDFLEIHVTKSGIMSGNSPMFENGRLTLIGVGTLDGVDYFNLDEVLSGKFNLKGLYIYHKKTGPRDVLPWDADILNYPVKEVKKK